MASLPINRRSRIILRNDRWPDDYKEIVAVFNGPHPKTGEDLTVIGMIAAPAPLVLWLALIVPGVG